MKKIIFILFSFCLFVLSCSNDDNYDYYDMYLSIEVVDNQGNNLLGTPSELIHKGETKANFGTRVCYLDSQADNRFTFRHIINETNSHIKIGCWWGDCLNNKITIDWGGEIEKDVIVFSYDSPLNGIDSPSHDFRYPYNITINGKAIGFNEETGHYIYVKDIQ